MENDVNLEYGMQLINNLKKQTNNITKSATLKAQFYPEHRQDEDNVEESAVGIV